MAGSPNRAPNKRSLLAYKVLQDLGCEPIKEMLAKVQDLENIKKKALEAYESHRGHGEKSDAGTGYLANATAATKAQIDIYNNLAKFQYPTLSAMGIKDLDNADKEAERTERVVNAAQVRETILNDPMAQVPTLAIGLKEK